MSKFNFNNVLSRKIGIHFIGIAALLLFFCSAFVAFPAKASAEDTGFVITDYYVEGDWHDNNVVTVREHIEVDFKEKRHGIFRSFPDRFYLGAAAYGGKETLTYYSKVKNIHVEEDKYSVDTEDGYTTIKIGNKYKTVTGKKSYDISYDFVIPDDRIDTMDFIYYSPLGAQWDTQIKHFSFSFLFDKDLPEDTINKINFYSGEHGSEENALNVTYDVTSNEIYGEASNIGPQNAITFYSSLPEGFFVKEKSVKPYLLYVFTALLFLSSAATIAMALFKKKKHIVQTVQFYPPENFTSAEVGVVMDESTDDVDMASLIPYWAAKGYITIAEDDKKSITLHKVKELPEDAPDYQLTLYDAFFKKDTCVLKRLGSRFAERYTQAKSELGSEFTDDKELSTGSGKAFLMGLLVSLSYFVILSSNTRLKFFDDYILGLFGAGALLVISIVHITMYGNMRYRKKRIIFYLIAVGLGLITYLNVWLCSGSQYNYFYSQKFMSILFLVAFGATALSGRIITETDYKIELLGKLFGLREFIRVAEKPRLEMLINENPDYYYEILPYAMVFGMADEWAKRFEDFKMESPQWYHSRSDDMMFNALLFQQTLTHSVVKPVQVANAKAAASHSSSGGFSGGGGGGGGGGSW
ncbi:MAG: DUF2207 domain-containing protein [Lachnospiraceae bacterium]|nr:DUF2207 domain-containing protein [Lachnospiraceae bacterium]